MKKIAIALVLMMSFISTPALSWKLANIGFKPPTETEDNKPLTNLEGYNIYWRVSSNNSYDNGVKLKVCIGCPAPNGTENESACVFLNPVSSATYIFVLTAYNPAGESVYSKEVSEVVTASLPRGNIDTVSQGSVNRVDGYDLSAMLWYFGEITINAASDCSTIDTILDSADLNEDGIIDVTDLTTLAANFGSSK